MWIYDLLFFFTVCFVSVQGKFNRAYIRGHATIYRSFSKVEKYLKD